MDKGDKQACMVLKTEYQERTQFTDSYTIQFYFYVLRPKKLARKSSFWIPSVMIAIWRKLYFVFYSILLKFVHEKPAF